MKPKYDMDTMSWEKKELIIAEAIVRRAVMLQEPFMLKGSLITRQYFSNPSERDIADLDWVYLGKIQDAESADHIFSNWMTKITLMDIGDDIHFTDFRKNQFWRRIDYAMSDDFPTVNTDIAYQLADLFNEELSLDISFHLEMPVAPVPLLYHPLYGEPFVIPYTPPLSLQIAWKLHQTIVRPRFKDLKDLYSLLQHDEFTECAFNETLLALSHEWRRDHYIYPERVKNLMKGEFQWLYNEIKNDYLWKHQKNNCIQAFQEFTESFSAVLKQAGFCEHTFRELYKQ